MASGNHGKRDNKEFRRDPLGTKNVLYLIFCRNAIAYVNAVLNMAEMATARFL